jgi:hypothetical protein
MSRKIFPTMLFPSLPRDPDTLVFWLTSTLCALFLLCVPGAIPTL